MTKKLYDTDLSVQEWAQLKPIFQNTAPINGLNENSLTQPCIWLSMADAPS